MNERERSNCSWQLYDLTSISQAESDAMSADERKRLISRYCNSCPLLIKCLAIAIEDEDMPGIAGGTTIHQRSKLRKSLFDVAGLDQELTARERQIRRLTPEDQDVIKALNKLGITAYELAKACYDPGFQLGKSARSKPGSFDTTKEALEMWFEKKDSRKTTTGITFPSHVQLTPASPPAQQD